MIMAQKIRFGYTPYPDTVYLLHGLLNDKVERGNFELEFVPANLKILNKHNVDGELDVSCISVRAYAELADQFDILASGGRFGNKHGPVIATRETLSEDEIRQGTIAVPDELGTASMLLELYAGRDVDTEVVPHSIITEQVERGNFDGGVVIDESFLSIQDTTLAASVDLGEWWYQETELPVPLGICIVNRNLDWPTEMGRIIHRSVQYGFDHPDETLEASREADPGRRPEQLRRFIDQYVNQYSLDMKQKGRRAIQELFNRAVQQDLLSHPVNPVFVDLD